MATKTRSPRARGTSKQRAAPRRPAAGKARTAGVKEAGKAAPAARDVPGAKPLAARMRVRTGSEVVLVGPPAGLDLGARDVTVRVATKVPAGAALVLLFARDRRELDARLAAAVPVLAPRATVWAAYPRKDTPAYVDLQRETVWEAGRVHGLRAVAQVAVDDTWSALRLDR